MVLGATYRASNKLIDPMRSGYARSITLFESGGNYFSHRTAKERPMKQMVAF